MRNRVGRKIRFEKNKDFVNGSEIPLLVIANTPTSSCACMKLFSTTIFCFGASEHHTNPIRNVSI